MMNNSLQAKDLRIGNLVIYSGYKQIFIISSINPRMITAENSFEVCKLDIEAFEPIPLTEEILVNNCGFTKVEPNKKFNRFIHEASGFELEQQGNKFALVIWTEHTPCTTHYIGHHEYLHELQNLFKVTENEELTIKF